MHEKGKPIGWEDERKLPSLVAPLYARSKLMRAAKETR